MRFLLLFILCLPAFGGSGLNITSELVITAEILQHAKFYHDKKKTLALFEGIGLGQAVNKLNTLSEVSPKNLAGYGDKRVWMVLPLENHRIETNLVLRYSYTSMHLVEVFLFDQFGRNVLRQLSGKLVPMNDRPIREIDYLFHLPLKGANRYTVIIRLETQGAMQFPFTILSWPRMYDLTQSQYLVFGLYYGAFILIALYSLSLFVTSGSSLYLSYLLYIICVMLAQLSLHGIGYKYLWPQFPDWNRISTVFLLGAMFSSLVVFTMRALETKNNTPKLHRVLFLFALLSLLTSGLAVFAYRTSVIQLVAALTAVLPLVILPVGIFARRSGSQFASYFLVGTSCYVFGVSIYALKDWGVVPSGFLTEYGVLFGSLAEVVVFSLGIGAQLRRLQIEAFNSVALSQVAAQVSHDIRSPLAALSMAESDFGVLPEDTRLVVRSAVGRIRDIASQLLERNRAANGNGSTVVAKVESPIEEAKAAQLLSSLIEDLISEKRMQFRSKSGIEIDGRFDTYAFGLFAEIQPTEFKRVISNLINNSVEALGHDGKISITMSASGDVNTNLLEIKVEDNGTGIQPEILAKLGRRGETHGKAGGSGLGLYHARKSIESWGGKLGIQSEWGHGTTVSVTLPKAKTPAWFVAELIFVPNSTVIILDDDESIHRVWDSRLESARLKQNRISVVHLSTPYDLRTWIKEGATMGSPVQFLIDYELSGFKETGLDLVEELNIASRSFLVTSRYEETVIRERCSKIGIRLIPKRMAGFVPIAFLQNSATASVKESQCANLIDVHISPPIDHLTIPNR